MKRIFLLLAILFSIGKVSQAQLNASDSLFFQAYEDTINAYSDSLFYSNIEANRIYASHAIAKNLTKALKRDNSFQYGFPNLKAISIVQPIDNKFRIFTYQLINDNNTYKYLGAVQMNSKNLQLIPLIDRSGMMDDDVTTTVTTANEWYGAIYYGIHKVKAGNREYYNVFGYDGNNALSTKKVIDVLWFDDNGTIQFGAPIFNIGKEENQSRYFIEYRKDVTASINYNSEYKKILIDHLIPENPLAEGQYYTYVPDGSYNGFEWKKNEWVFIEKVFDFKLKDGEFPIGY